MGIESILFRDEIKYACGVCSYTYDPQVGDPNQWVSAMTPFEDLPDDWVCPFCGADKLEFYPEQ